MKTFMKKHGKIWYRFYDFQHITKNMRNILFSRDLLRNAVEFSIDTLMSARHKYKNLPDKVVKYRDAMKWEPVKALLDTKVINDYMGETASFGKNYFRRRARKIQETHS